MVSIIIPVYNHSKRLSRCLASIARQTYADREVIIVDDGSEPPLDVSVAKSLDTSFHCRFERIPHAGAPAARNRGFLLSKGEYVLFCDADVVMKPHMLEAMLQALSAHPEASYAYASFRFGWKNFRLWPFDAEKLKLMNYIHTTSLIRREVFPGFDESLTRFQDWDLWLTLLEQGKRGIWASHEVLFSVAAGGTMSRWLPKNVYHLLRSTGIASRRVSSYDCARAIVLKKHSLEHYVASS